MDLWKKVEYTVMLKIIQLSKQPNAVRPLFDGAGWVDGHKLVTRGNDAALRLIRESIEGWLVDGHLQLKMRHGRFSSVVRRKNIDNTF